MPSPKKTEITVTDPYRVEKTNIQANWIMIKVWTIKAGNPQALIQDEFPEDDDFIIPSVAAKLKTWSGDLYLKDLWIVEKEVQPPFNQKKNLKVIFLYFPTRTGKKDSNNLFFSIDGKKFQVQFLQISYA